MLSCDQAGSSAAGEQPKFLATRIDGDDATPVLVKFSPPIQDAPSQRIANLLISEHLALQTLQEAGVAAARSQIISAGGRIFLEVERFDRVGSSGRRGVVSFRALDNEFVGSERQRWEETADGLYQQGLMSDETQQTVYLLARFGDWIGNTDKHAGNLSMFFEGGQIGGLTPVYDMLPMGYYPRNAEIVPFHLKPPFQPNFSAELERRARAWAARYWESVAGEPRITADFRQIAQENMTIITNERENG